MSTRIIDMPDLGAFNDSASLVGDLAGSGRFLGSALRTYIGTFNVTSVAGHAGDVTLTHADLTDWAAELAGYLPITGGALTGSTSVTGNFLVTGAVTLGGTTVTGDLTATGQVNAATLAIAGTTNLGTAAISGSASVGGNFSVAGAVSLGGTNVVGNLSASGTITNTTGVIQNNGFTLGATGMLYFRAPTVTTSAGAGSSTALPATPQGYLTVTIGGSPFKVAYYNLA